MDENNIHLTSSEIGAIWTNYNNDCMSKCMLKFMLKYIQDNDIKPIVQQAYNMATSHLEDLTPIFGKENYAMPIGFHERDIYMDAPWLFTDIFCLTYVNHMARVAMLSYSGFAAVSYREDVCNLYSKYLKDVNNLYNQSMKIALKKGVNARHPYIQVPKETEYVESKKYYSGLNPFSDKRPLNAIEISHLYLNIMTNSIGSKLCLAFAQTSPSKEVQEFMLRGKDISNKHVKIFADLLLKDSIDAPQLPDAAISDSVTKTFSDKLMMFHISLLTASGIGNYAMAGAASQRSDLMLNYERLSFEVARLAKSGSDIMIQNNWLEQPPGTKNRDKLSREKEG